MMTILKDRTWGSSLSTLASIQWTRRYKRRSRHYATVARSFISMAHYLVMCLTTTARRSMWIASRLKSNFHHKLMYAFDEVIGEQLAILVAVASCKGSEFTRHAGELGS